MKDIIGYEGQYAVTEDGKVWSYKTKRFLVTSVHRNGYIKVSLWKNNKQKTYFMHRLVAEAFIPNPDNLPQVNHKDENKTNNCVSNLEWCTHKYNNNYGSKRDATKGVNNPKAKLNEDDIVEIRKLYKPHSKSNGAKALAEKFGVSYHHIYHIVRNDRWGWL